MKLFLAELRQIFTLRFLLLVAAAAGVYTYSVFHYANTQLSYYFPAEPSDGYTSSLKIEKDLANFVLEDGRTAVTDGDLKTFSDNLAKTKELETFFSETEAFREYGITCLQDYKDLEKELDDAYYKESSSDPDDPALPALQERSEKIWEIIIASGKEDDFREWMFLEDTIGYMQEDYANRHEPSSYILDTYPSETQRARLKEIYSGDMGSPSSSLPSIMRNALITPYTIFSSFLFSVLFMTIVWRNRSRRIHLLQYSAHAGRRILAVEFLSALATCTLLLIIFLIPLLCIIGEYGLTRYFSLPVTGFLSTTMLWFDMNIGMYLFLPILLTYVLCAGATLISVCISRLCRNFVACAACSLPLLAGSFMIGEIVYNFPFSLSYPKLTETSLSVTLLLLGIAGAWFLCHREKKLDIS